MTKAKDTADAERQARRRRLEALRDDCRRHKRGAVALAQRRREGRDPCLEKPILAARTEEDEHDSRGFLDRLGEVLAEAPDQLERLGMGDSGSEWRRSRKIAMEALLHARPWRKVIETSATFLDQEDRPTSTPEIVCLTLERRVADLVAAIAELCDELLEVKPSAAAPKQASRTDDQKFAQASAILLQEFERSGKMLRQNQVAARIGMREEDLSRLVGKSGDKHDSWKRLKESLVSRRPDSKATRSVDDEDE
jgi:hypothetical protein